MINDKIVISFRPFLCFLQSCLFTFNSVVWYLPINTAMFYMEFDLDFVNLEEEEGLEEIEEGEGVNQSHSKQMQRV